MKFLKKKLIKHVQTGSSLDGQELAKLETAALEVTAEIMIVLRGLARAVISSFSVRGSATPFNMLPKCSKRSIIHVWMDYVMSIYGHKESEPVWFHGRKPILLSVQILAYWCSHKRYEKIILYFFLYFRHDEWFGFIAFCFWQLPRIFFPLNSSLQPGRGKSRTPSRPEHFCIDFDAFYFLLHCFFCFLPVGLVIDCYCYILQ